MAKFKIGDRVVCVSNISKMLGRPRVRIIERVFEPNSDGVICYGGQFWKSGEDNLVLESEYQWPSESEMKFMDRRHEADMSRMFNEFCDHAKESED